MKSQSLVISDIQHFSVHDGPGIRTTVFLKGCPLDCRWCHNPESIDSGSNLLFYDNVCTSCGDCVPACPEGCLTLRADNLEIVRDSCTLCGLCVPSCHHGALEIKGREVAVSEIVKECLLDRDFYKETGGVTLSGGEPLFRQEAVFSLMEKLKYENIHLVLDTCGAVDYSLLHRASLFIDLFYFDCKCVDAELHREWTGVSNTLILDNLIRLLKTDASVVVRIPVIPGFNGNPQEIEKIAGLLKPFSTKTTVHLLPYHQLGSNKYNALGRDYHLGKLKSPDKKTLSQLESIFTAAGLAVKTFEN